MLAYKNQTHICKSCFADFDNDSFHSLFNEMEICKKCIKEYHPRFKEFCIDEVKGLAIYFYEGKIKENIFVYKGCFDYELKNTFLIHLKTEIKLMYFNYFLVPIPSSLEDDKKRGFNHVVEIFKILELPLLNVLEKTKRYKQSELSYNERKKSSDALSIKNGEVIKDKNILVVDDICTTGSTLKTAIRLIKLYKPKRIKILVVAKREFSKKELEKIKNLEEII